MRSIAIHFILPLLVLTQLMLGGVAHAEHDKSSGGRAPISGEGPVKKSAVPEECHARGSAIVDFANGEGSDFEQMVHFLTYPDCTAKAPYLAKSMIKQIKFQDKGPYRLDAYAKQVAGSDPAAADSVEKALAGRIPDLLRQYPLTNSEMLPVVGQLAVLSQPAARITMANVIAQDLFKSGKDFDLTKPGWETNAKVLAGRLSTLGANEDSIMSELATMVQQLALLVQVDSLGNLFRGLAAASGVDRTLVPTFNLSASALSHGIEGASDIHTSAEKAKLLGAVFVAIQSAVETKAAVEVGAAELNEAMDSLLQGRPLHATSLRNLWKEVVRILSASPNQNALAKAIGESLTPEYLYLDKKELQTLYAAAANYPSIAHTLELRMLDGWAKNWDSVQRGRMKVAQFNELRSRIFDPAIETLLQLEPASLSTIWMRELVARGLLTDAAVEKRFPKLALALLEDRERGLRQLASSGTAEDRLQYMGRDMALNWQFFRIYLPALFRWVDSQEAETQE